MTAVERGKDVESPGMRMFYRLTTALAKATAEHIIWTPGIVCLAIAE
jgi:hypothetical protein